MAMFRRARALPDFRHFRRMAAGPHFVKMNIVVGTYEELILGYHIDLDAEPKVTQHFTDHSHVGAIKAATVSHNGILATGSSDEVIRLFNLTKSKELGSLIQHNGSITDLCFFESYLFSASEDGTVIVWKTKKWEPQRTLRGHKDVVYSFAVHPSGKMALSVSKDKTMKTWNLMTAKCAYTTNLKNVADAVVWSCDGEKYAVLYRTYVDIYSVQSSKVESTIKPGTGLSTAVFLEEQILLLGGEGGKMYLYDLSQKEPQKLLEVSTSTNRVKRVRVDDSSTCDTGKYVATAGSDGKIQIWKITKHKKTWKCEMQCDFDCKFRPVSLAFGRRNEELVKEEDDDSGEEEEEENSEDDEESEAEEIKPKKKSVKRPAPNDDETETSPQKKFKKSPKLKSKNVKKVEKQQTLPQTKKGKKKKKVKIGGSK